MTWTPERIAQTRIKLNDYSNYVVAKPEFEDVQRGLVLQILNRWRQTLDALESLQAELDAARDVVEAARMVGRFDEGDFSDVVDAVERYDAARAEQETT